MPENAAVSATRVRYRERQLLRAADLAAEQAYLITMRRRHHRSGHGWGIVCGLALEQLSDGMIVLQPGMAVDGYGRELFVPTQVPLPLADVFADANGIPAAADAWLLYSLTARNTSQSGRWDCAPGQINRRYEEPLLRLIRLASAEEKIDPRHPVEVAEEDSNFRPHEFPPDDPVREWPIYLGRVMRATTGAYSIKPKGRPYVALVGDSLRAPSGQAQMLIGGETAHDPRRFVIRTLSWDGKLTDKLVLDREGNAALHGNATILGDNKRLLAAAHLRFDPLAAPPAVAAPWQVYRVTTQKEGKKLNQLQFEIAHPGKKDDPKLYQFVVGVRNGNHFTPCLVVEADCTVRIMKDAKLALAADSRVIEGPIQPDPDDPRFIQALEEQWKKTLLGNASALVHKSSNEFLGKLQIVLFQADKGTKPGAAFNFKFTVLNQSQVGITKVTPMVKLTFIESPNKGTTVPVTVAPTGFPLTKGASQIVTVTSGLLDSTVMGGTLKIEIVVSGLGPLGNLLFDLLNLELPVAPELEEIPA